MDDILSEIIPYLPETIAEKISLLALSVQTSIREIRFSAGHSAFLVLPEGRRELSGTDLTESELAACFRRICGSSSYTYQEEIQSGYRTLPGGHRVGIVGTAVRATDGQVTGIRSVSGLCIRVSRDHTVDLKPVLKEILLENRVRNLLIAGPPCSGKTTVLRTLSRELSRGFQVAVIDERGELFPDVRGSPVGCDVLRGYPKSTGILQALRTLSPQIIVCDEIGDAGEACAMLDGLRGGVSFLCSAHTSSPGEILCRPAIRTLLTSGGIETVAFLSRSSPGRIAEIFRKDELMHEGFSSVSDLPVLRRGWDDLCS